MSSYKCDDFWIYNSSILFTNPTFCPKLTCGTEVANVFFRALIISIIIGGIFAIIYGSHSFIISLVLMIIMMIPTIIGFFTSKEIIEEKKEIKKVDAPKPFIAPISVEGFTQQEKYRYPTPANPFMNPLPGEDATKPSAAPIDDKQVRQELDDYFRIQWFSDPTDVFGKSQNQRQFISMPSTSIPNDLDSYKNWLYGLPEKTCKEGDGSQCRAGTDGGVLAWNSME